MSELNANKVSSERGEGMAVESLWNVEKEEPLEFATKTELRLKQTGRMRQMREKVVPPSSGIRSERSFFLWAINSSWILRTSSHVRTRRCIASDPVLDAIRPSWQMLG